MSLPVRKLPRMRGYDYSAANYYFVTVCTAQKKHLFGAVGKLNSWGELAESELLNVSAHYDCVKIDKYIVMPNHIHAIIVIDHAGAAERSRPFPTLSRIVGLYKAGVSRKLGMGIWQRSFHDRIIRNEQEYLEVWRYIDENPLKWAEDEYHSNN